MLRQHSAGSARQVPEIPVDATVLVTGGSGFVGGHVIVGLLNRGYRVNTTIRSLYREPEVHATSCRWIGLPRSHD